MCHFDEDHRGNGGWSIRFRLLCECHKCGSQEEQSTVRKNWLTPWHVWQGNGWLQTQLCPDCAKWKPLYWIKVVWRIRIGRLSNWLAPGYGACGRCHTNWHFCEGHSTDVPGTGSGLFPLCEQCWAELAPAQRLPYYRELYESWREHRDYSWDTLKAAVLNEPRL